jgi:dTDP-4-dehydrorhamnose 3,5-epimerase-like enzyme
MNTLDNIQLLELPTINEESGSLILIDKAKNFSFSSQQVYAIKAIAGAKRGRHAHKTANQILSCLHGQCDILCDDGSQTKTITLSQPDQALYIPTGIWAEQNYHIEGSILMVLCDTTYNEHEYIRNYSAFLNYRHSLSH